jgi:hypothetical protein
MAIILQIFRNVGTLGGGGGRSYFVGGVVGPLSKNKNKNYEVQ